MNKSLLVLLAASGMATNFIHAQEAAADAAPAPAQGEPLELPGLEITGRVFEENTAYAGTYSVIDFDAIELSNIEDVEDLSGAVPGLHVTDTNGRSFGNVYTLRGIGNTPLFGTSGVVFYLDDVPQGDPSSINSSLGNLDSIRVYRGPQGHLFGRNSSAGVISMQSRQPGEARETEVDLTVGEFGTLEYGIFTSAPIKNGMSYTFSLNHAERDGYIYNSTLGRREDERDHTGGRFTFNFEVGDGFDVTLGVAVDEYDDGAQGFVRITDLDPGTFAVTRNGNYYTSTADTLGVNAIDRNQQWIKVSKDFDWGKLSSITSRLDWEVSPNVQDLDFGATVLPGMVGTVMQSQDTWTQEFRFEQVTDNKLSFNGGLFYLNTEIDGDAERLYPSPGGYVTDTTINTTEEENLAIFGSFQYDFSEKIELFGGLRWDHTERSLIRNKTTVIAPFATINDPTTYTSIPAAPIDVTSDFHQLTPSFGATYSISDTTKLFAKTAIGYKPGGYSAYTDATNLKYDEEQAWTTEIGITLEPNSNWRMVLAAFWSEIDDYQFEKNLSPLSTDYAIINADEVVGKGVEAELAFQPTENLLFTAALGINDMTFDRHAGFEDNRVPFAPRHTFNLGAQYKVSNGFFGRIEYRSVGDTFYDEENSVEMLQDAYSVINASIGYEIKGYNIQVFGRNLNDENYYTNISAVNKAGGLIGGMAGTPQLFGVSLSKHF
jgi:iron complex outermembrane receptor protein